MSEEGGLNPQLRYVKRGKLRVVEIPHRLRLDPATVIKTVVEKEKPEVVNITAMAWLGDLIRPRQRKCMKARLSPRRKRKCLVSITFDDSATKYFSVFELLRRGDEIELRDGLGSDVTEADITIGAGEPEKEILQGATVHEVHRATAPLSPTRRGVRL